ncbi:ABC transporter substrate-binding protein [Halomarina oriensis]|uniref:SsuA/THI5-like domain-containing protein n=1 Tax=Halomarina oriensis TaxID=671145 RepID=A0A6B0GQX4_9EURY|nr:ABC transporter substrate-binding protein [Halomarina oriensis]MWG34525.1 hypothetical protein [Halomarina oriensis]
MQQGDTGCGNTTRRTVLGATGTALAASVAGCLGNGDESNDSGGGGDGQTTGDSSGGGSSGTFSTEATVTHWPILMYSPPYQAALDQGYFEEEGVDIENFVGSSGGGTTVRNVVTGGLAFGEVATPAAVNAYYAGAPLTIIGSATNTPGTINWVAPKGSDVSSITDLAGKKVGYTSAGSVTQNTSALAVKRADGISPDDVEFQAMGGVSEGLTALDKGSIAAAANLDPVFSSQQAGEEQWQVAFWAKDYIEEFQQTCLIAGGDVLEQNPEAVRGFMRARARGVQFVRENPEEMAEIFASHNEGYDADVMAAAIENVGPDEYYTENGFSVGGLRTIEEGMKNIDLIDRDVEWTEIIDQSYLPEEKHVDLSQL